MILEMWVQFLLGALSCYNCHMTSPGHTEVIEHDETDIDEPLPDETPELLEGPSYPERNITSLAQLHTVMEDDVARTNYALTRLDQAWAAATHPDEVCRVAMTQTHLLINRRKFLNMKLGSAAGKGNDRDPYDD